MTGGSLWPCEPREKLAVGLAADELKDFVHDIFLALLDFDRPASTPRVLMLLAIAPVLGLPIRQPQLDRAEVRGGMTTDFHHRRGPAADGGLFVVVVTRCSLIERDHHLGIGVRPAALESFAEVRVERLPALDRPGADAEVLGDLLVGVATHRNGPNEQEVIREIDAAGSWSGLDALEIRFVLRLALVNFETPVPLERSTVPSSLERTSLLEGHDADANTTLSRWLQFSPLPTLPHGTPRGTSDSDSQETHLQNPKRFCPFELANQAVGRKTLG